MKALRAIVVEDSRLARAGLVRMLDAFPQVEVIGEADHPDTALPLIREARPDVLFLDIQMAGANAFDLLVQLKDELKDALQNEPGAFPRIIFTTAHAEYAIRSFDFDTVDYLLKPISHERLAQAIRKLGGHQSGMHDTAQDSLPARPPLEAKSRIFIKDGERCHMVSLESISCFESCRNYVQVFFGNQRAYIKKSLGSVEESLPKNLFFRISRQHIVNLHAIAAIEESMSAGYLLTLDNGKKLDISRRNAAELKETLSL
jgi:two-component system LytT family response regulator